MRIALLAALAAASLSLGACASGPTFYDPASGQRVAAVDGDCMPGASDEQGRVCTCSRDRAGNYVDCGMRLTGRAAPRPQYSYLECFVGMYDYQSCLAGRVAYGYRGNGVGYIARDYDPTQYRWQPRGGYNRPLPDNGARRVQGQSERPTPYQPEPQRQGNLPTVRRD